MRVVIAMSTYQLHQTARGLYKVAVVDATTKEVIWEQKEWGKNLILNNGLNAVRNIYWEGCFSSAAAGTGVTPTSISSAGVTASQAGTTVSASVGSYTFSSGDIGNMIKWDAGGEEARITAYTNPQSVEVTPSQSVGSGTFSVYQTNQTDLTTEVKRTTTYLTGSPYCQTVIDTSTGVVAMRRTYDFTAETVQKNYTEVGTCWSGAFGTGNTTFSRILLPLPITVNAGQQLRFVYELQLTLSPVTPAALSAAVSGWPVLPSVNTDATQQLELLQMSYVSSSGVATTNNGYANEPAASGLQGGALWASPSSAPFTTFNGAAPDRRTGHESAYVSLSAYTPLSFTVDKTATFLVGQMNRNDIRSIGLSPNDPFYGRYTALHNGITVLFDQPQTKTNTQTLTFTFRFTWGRTLA